MRYLLIVIIKLYQITLSPLIGNGCIYRPSCSVYAIEAIREFGAVKGGWLAAKRVFRCVPWKAGGFDPIPYNLKGEMKWLF